MGYETIRLTDKEKEVNFNRINKRKMYKPDEYYKILEPYLDFENMTYAQYVEQADIGNKSILLIRHDVDHDHVTAVKIAEWEYKHNLRSTYCLLHTSWYYGKLEGDRIIHTQDLVETAKRLQDLGHEINFHNNLVVTALMNDINPSKLLEQELDFFDSIGITIKGTSTHGDRLCREMNFRNWELFKECCDDRFGGPRTLEYKSGMFKTRKVTLGEVSMFDFGLTYEGYDVHRDVYHTDSGGNIRTRENCKGRRDFGRKDYKNSKVVGVLTHPIWWDFY